MLKDGTPLAGVPPDIVTVFTGLTNFEVQEAILIHELLHFTGVVGADDAGQTSTLGNGEVVQGSQGVSKAVKEHCFP